MTVTIHNTTLTSGPASAGARVLLHTATAGSCLLVWNWTNEANSLSAVAAAGVAMTRLGLVSAGTSTVEVWGLTAPASGTLTISAIGVGTQANLRGLIATSYVGQRQVGGSPFGTFVGGTASGTVSDLSVSSTTSDLVAFGFGISAVDASITLGNGTSRGTATLSTRGRLVVGDITGATTVSLSASSSVTGIWGMVGLPIVASVTPATSIVFDNAAATGTSGAVTSLGMLLTATSGAVLVVFINSDGGDQTISAVNIGATQLTRLDVVEYGGGSPARVELWVLTAPPSGVLTISAVIADGTTGAFNMAGATYVGHRTTATPFGGTVVNSAGAGLTISVSVSSTAGNVVVAGFGSRQFNPPTLTVGPGMVQRQGPLVFPAIIIGDTIGGPAITAVALNTSASTWGTIGLNLIQSGSAQSVTGTFSATEAADSFVATGQIIVRGAMSATESSDAFSASGGVRILGTFSATDAPDVFSASARTRISGLLSATDAPDTFSASGYTVVRGIFAATESSDTFSASGYVLIRGLMNATESQDIFSASGNVLGGTITGIFSATEATDTFSASGYVLITGTFAATDESDIFFASGTAVPLFTTGVFSATEAQDIFLATGTSDPATGSTPPAVVVSADTVSIGGKPERRRKKNKPPYIQAPSDFWDARERYLKALQPEMAEPEPPPDVKYIEHPDVNPANVSPVLLAGYIAERNEIVTAIPLAKSMRELRSYGERLRSLNKSILEEKIVQLRLAYAEISAIKQVIAERRRIRANRLTRKRKLLAALEIARSLARLYINHPE